MPREGKLQRYVDMDRVLRPTVEDLPFVLFPLALCIASNLSTVR